ncbi:MAG: F0F1 ATP synthase subunit B [Pseudomonadales bacterium]|nr:F0F1 ATP synthase subunit B [Pseudomonadales bacterium]
MNMNATMILQGIAFFVFAWFIWKFGWPVLLNAMHERQATIAAGLEHAEKAKRQLREADHKAQEALRQAQARSQEIIDQARAQAGSMIEQAKQKAQAEGERIKEAARADLEQERHRAREGLRADVAALAVAGAERILGQAIDPEQHRRDLDRLAAEL